MKLQEAYSIIERLKGETTKKSTLKGYTKLLHIFSALKSRDFSEEEMKSIEKELGNFNLDSNSANSHRFSKKVLSRFEDYLKTTFSLTTKGYYTNRALAFGTSFGLLFGVVFLSSFERSMGISLGMMGGMFIGLTIGRSMEAKAVSEGRIL